MKYKLLSILLSIQIIFIPVLSYAEITETTEGRIESIKKGQPAPFDGSILDPIAIAKILAEREYQKKKCDLEKKYEVDKAKAKAELERDKYKIELDIANKKYDEINKIKTDEIDRLRKLVSEKKDYTVVWVLVGIGTGILLSLGTFYTVREIRN